MKSTTGKKKELNYILISALLILAVIASYIRSLEIVKISINCLAQDLFVLGDITLPEEWLFIIRNMQYPLVPFSILATVSLLKSKNRKHLIAIWGLIAVIILEKSNIDSYFYAGWFSLIIVIVAIPSILLLLNVVIKFKPKAAVTFSLTTLIICSLALLITTLRFVVNIKHNYDILSISLYAQYFLFYVAMLVFSIEIFIEAWRKKKLLIPEGIPRFINGQSDE